jgi:hypothetical protein
MMKKNLMLAIAFGLATLASNYYPLSAEQADQACFMTL